MAEDASIDCSQRVELIKLITNNDLSGVEEQLHYFKDVNFTMSTLRFSPLQIASNLSQRESHKIVKALLNKGANPLHADQIGRTALYHASTRGNYKTVKLLLEHNADPNKACKLSTEWDNDRQDTIFETGVCGKLHFPDCWGRNPLHQAAINVYADVVKILLNYGAKADVCDEWGLTPLLLLDNKAADNKPQDYLTILEMLIKEKVDTNREHPTSRHTALHGASKRRCRVGGLAVRALLANGAKLDVLAKDNITPLHVSASAGSYSACVALLSAVESNEGVVSMINQPDDVGRTSMHHAANHSCSQDVLRLLAACGGDLAARTNSGHSVVETLFARVHKAHHVLLDMMDERITTSQPNPDDHNFVYKLDFSLFTPHGEENQMAVISDILFIGDNYQHNLLAQHPLIDSFLRMKWHKFRSVLYTRICIQTIFALSLSGYILCMVYYPANVYLIIILEFVMTVSSVMVVLTSMIQVFLMRQFRYDVLINITGALMAVLLGVQGFAHSVKYTSSFEELPVWTLHVASYVVIFVWYSLMLMSSEFPSWGHYVMIFNAVLSTILKILLMFISLIIGFSLSFMIQYNKLEDFSNPWNAITKMMPMIMSDYGYNDLFGINAKNKPLVVTNRIIFVSFVLLLSIVLINLMVGLAISDIQDLEKDGYIRQIVNRVSYLCDVERICLNKLFQCKLFPFSSCKCWFRKMILVPTSVCLRASPHLSYPKSMTEEEIDSSILSQELIENIANTALQNLERLELNQSSLKSHYMNWHIVRKSSEKCLLRSLLKEMKSMKHHLKLLVNKSLESTDVVDSVKSNNVVEIVTDSDFIDYRLDRSQAARYAFNNDKARSFKNRRRLHSFF